MATAMKEMLAGKKFGVSACGKLYRSSDFRDARFPKGKRKGSTAASIAASTRRISGLPFRHAS